MSSIRLKRTLVLFLVIIIKHVQTTVRNCEIEEDEIAKVRFIDPEFGTLLKIQYQTLGIFPAFADIRHYSKKNLDFKVSNVDSDELYSVIMMQQGTYARLEPDGEVRLKWFVSNIPGEDLRKGKRHWGGTVLAEFEKIITKGKFPYTILWVFKHIDNETIIDEPHQQRTDFVLQNYYDFLCSRPIAEVVFIREEYQDQADIDIAAAKKIGF